MSDQDNARAVVYMPVVRNVQQQLLTDLVLNPTVKDVHHCIEIQLFWILQQQLHLDVLHLQARRFLENSLHHAFTNVASRLLQLCAASMKSCASSIKYRLDSDVCG